jgi:Domain of unknown function (DUF5664)
MCNAMGCQNYMKGWSLACFEHETEGRYTFEQPTVENGGLERSKDRIGTAAERKNHPIVTGCLDYFSDALLDVAEVSRIGNEQHNPGEPLHWAKEKSSDEADSLVRHLIDRGTRDSDGMRHSAKVAWRALALLQREIEAERSLTGTR